MGFLASVFDLISTSFTGGLNLLFLEPYPVIDHDLLNRVKDKDALDAAVREMKKDGKPRKIKLKDGSFTKICLDN